MEPACIERRDAHVVNTDADMRISPSLACDDTGQASWPRIGARHEATTCKRAIEAADGPNGRNFRLREPAVAYYRDIRARTVDKYFGAARDAALMSAL